MLAKDMRFPCQWQRTWLLTACSHSKRCKHQPVYITSLCLSRPTEVMQKCLERCYASSRFVLQVTGPELGDQRFLQHIVSRSALWPKGRQCLILQGCSLQTFLRNSLNKERVRSSILGTPSETCKSRSEPQWRTDFSTETWCVAVQKTLDLWDVWELPNVNMLL